jgi:hypothetical protein
VWGLTRRRRRGAPAAIAIATGTFARLRRVDTTSRPHGRRWDAAQAARLAGVPLALHELRERLWSNRVHVGLTSDLSGPVVTRGELPIQMRPVDAGAFTGFRDELGKTSGRDALESLGRQRMCDAGVETLYVTVAGDGRPVYAQWCINASGQAVLARLCPNDFPPARDGQVLLEGAYTFTAFRGMRAMADGMSQLVRAARQAGARSALTYVNIDNVPSLRGCAACGFRPDHMRIDRWRFGHRRSAFAPLSSATADRFAHATAPRRRTRTDNQPRAPDRRAGRAQIGTQE